VNKASVHYQPNKHDEFTRLPFGWFGTPAAVRARAKGGPGQTQLNSAATSDPPPTHTRAPSTAPRTRHTAWTNGMAPRVPSRHGPTHRIPPPRSRVSPTTETSERCRRRRAVATRPPTPCPKVPAPLRVTRHRHSGPTRLSPTVSVTRAPVLLELSS